MGASRADVLTPSGLVDATERLYRSLFTAAAAFALSMAIWGIVIAPFNSFHHHAPRSVMLGLALAAPSALVLVRRQEAFELLRRRPATVLLFVGVALAVLWLDGGWRSSYYLASYAAIALAAVACGIRWSLACGALLAAGYVLGVVVNGYSWEELRALHDADSVVANTGGYLIAGYFFAAPVAWLARYVARINQVAGFSRAPEPTSQQRRLGSRRTATLSAREIQVVQLIADGETNQAIAERLFLSPRTIQSHVESAMRKTESKNRAELAVAAYSEGLVPPK